MSNKAIERMKSFDLRKRISESVKKRFADPEFKEAFKKKLKEVKGTEKVRINMRKAQLGKKLSEETRQKISRALKGKNVGKKGKKPSEETKKKMRESHKKVWSDKEYQKYFKQRVKESTNTPEHKKKCSDRAKDMWADPVKKQKMLQLRKEFGKKLNRFSDEQEVEIVKRRGRSSKRNS